MFKMRFVIIAIAVAGFLGCAGAIRAQLGPGGSGGGTPPRSSPTGLISEFNAEQIAKVLTFSGKDIRVVSEVEKMQNGFERVIIHFPQWPDSVTSGAYGMICKDEAKQIECDVMHLFVNIGKNAAADSKWLNGWNRDVQFPSAFKTEDGDLIFAWDTVLAQGVSVDNLRVTALFFWSRANLSSKYTPSK
jgi:hypothetical protein